MTTVRAAANNDVEVAALDRENFAKLIADSQATKKEINRVAQQRIRESLDLTKGTDNA
jgi:CRP-like cAMP-binding protein